MIDRPIVKDLQKHCEFLADPEMNGRVPGKEGNRRAREYIRCQFEEVGLEPLFGKSWYQAYRTRASGREIAACNVGGVLRSAEVQQPSILVGAHFDHLEGIPGADDNASSVAIIIETARLILKTQDKDFRRKSLMFVAFDAEERPFYLTEDMGSIHFFNNMPVRKLDAAVILDLCGHDFPIPGKENAVFVMGVDSSVTLAEELPSIRTEGLTAIVSNDRYVGDKSDYFVFKNAGIPYVFISAGWWECYHKPCDTLDRLNYRKMQAIVHFLVAVLQFLGKNELVEGRVDTTELEASYLSHLIGCEVPPERSAIDGIVEKIKANYLGRAS